MPCLGCVWKKPKVRETGTATLNDDRDGLDGFVATRPQQAVIVTTTTTPCCRGGIDGDDGFGCLGCSRSPFLGSLGFCAVDWQNALIFEAGWLVNATALDITVLEHTRSTTHHIAYIYM